MGNRLRVYNHANEIFEKVIEEIKKKNEKDEQNEQPDIKVEIQYYQSGAYSSLPTFTSGFVDELTKSEIILKNNGHPIKLEKIIALDVYFPEEKYAKRIYYKGKIIKVE
jgi:hypothetical protein